MRYFKGKIPVWFFGDSTLLDEQPGIRKILRRLWLTWVYRHVDNAFYVGTNNKNYYQAHGLREDQLVFFPHAVDNQRFFDTPERNYESKARQMRHDLGFSDDDLVLLFAGKLEAKKNPEILLKAVNSINRQEKKPIFLLIIGNGPLESQLKQIADGNDLIKFLPFQNQSVMPVMHRIGDLFCLPSRGPGETWGLAVNEALACGRPVLVSNRVGCSIDLVKSKINGEIFHWHDESECAEKIRTLTGYCKTLRHADISETIASWSFERKCKAIERHLDIQYG
jgi:glycosyltransferase involved in cell wall biosynthesis